MTIAKATLDDFALFGGPPLFDSVRSTSNLVQPNFERFLAYSKLIFEGNRFSHANTVVGLLERRLAEFHVARNCVSFCSGFWALVLAIKAVAIAGKTEVIMPSLTYRRLADIVAWAGLIPHFCEVDPKGLCITAETARSCVNKETALILGVHPIVNCCDVSGLDQLSTERSIPLVFDSVESAYETVNGRRVGSFGGAECFSMHASKLVNAFEGGYVTTNDDALAERLRQMRVDGSCADTAVPVQWMDVRQNEIHAAMALAGLDEITTQVEINKRRYYEYKAGLADVCGLRLLTFDEREQNGFKNIVVELTDEWPIDRDTTLSVLHKENLLCRAYYHPPLHKKPVGYATVHGDLRQTEELSRRYMTLPCGYFVSERDVESICGFLSTIQSYGEGIAKRSLNPDA